MLYYKRAELLSKRTKHGKLFPCMICENASLSLNYSNARIGKNLDIDMTNNYNVKLFRSDD